jgi:ATP-dependent Lhr-like helicase
LISDLENQVSERFKKLGWKELTPIQRKAFPVILRRRNSLLIAPTGSGKTEAALVPIIVSLAAKQNPGPGIKGLYVTPLRALNRDIFRRVIDLAHAVGLTAEVRHGDTPVSTRRRITENPPDLLITTPETLAILLTGKKSKIGLRSIEWIVVDELHELIASERGSHLSISLERLNDMLDSHVVRIGLSATVGDPTGASKFLAGTGKESAILVDHSVRGYDITSNFIEGTLPDVATKLLEHLAEIKNSAGTTLLFTNTRVEAESIGAILKAKSPDYPVEVHHGSLSKELREDTETRMRGGTAGIVVCTSSLELGLDIGAVQMVVQLGSPRQAVKLIQRMGRSRHQVGSAAKGFIIGHRDDDELESLALIDRVKENDLEPGAIHEKPYDVMAHHAAGLTIERGRADIADLLVTFKRAYPFRDLTIDEAKDALALLDKQSIIRFDGETIRRSMRTFQYYYENISTIPDLLQFDVIDITKKRLVGRLDQMFVGEYGEPGKPFVLRGNSWRIVSINDDKKTVHVEPIFRDTTTIPYWIGELIPVDRGTAIRVGRLRRAISAGSENRISEHQRRRMFGVKETLGSLPDERSLVIERQVGQGIVVLHFCYGSKVNQTIATVLSTLISSKTGFMVEARSDPYRIMLSSQGKIGIDDIRASLKEDLNLEEILSVAVVGTHPLNWKTWYVAKKFGVVGKESQYDRRAARLIQARYRNTPLYREIMRELIHEKYDIAGTAEVLGAIADGVIAVSEVYVPQFSSLATPILEFSSAFAAIPLTVERSILDLVKERLEGTNNRLVCMNCGKWESVAKPKDLANPVSCPLCKSRLVTTTFFSNYDLVKIILKKRQNKRLTNDEERQFKKAWKTSSLVQNFGPRAVMAFSGFGVGPDTAARVLRKSMDEDEFLKNVYLAEKNYVRTRGFWKD